MHVIPSGRKVAPATNDEWLAWGQETVSPEKIHSPIISIKY